MPSPDPHVITQVFRATTSTFSLSRTAFYACCSHTHSIRAPPTSVNPLCVRRPSFDTQPCSTARGMRLLSLCTVVVAFVECRYNAVQVGAGRRRAKRLTKSQLGHLRKHLGEDAAKGANPKRAVHEFRVSEDALLPEGTLLTARHFKPGQVCGWRLLCVRLRVSCLGRRDS